jgi:anti-sigma-K factor RskA
MNETHTTFQENLAAYALGALDPEETAALEAHLGTCDSCRAELAGYQQVSSGLLAALPARPPRAAVRRALEARLAGGVKKAKPQLNWSFGRLAFGALMAALVGLNVLMVSQLSSLRREQAEVHNRSTAEQTALAMLAYPSTKALTFDENGVSGSVLVDKQRNLVAVFAWNLAALPAGKTYQLWLIDPQGDRTSGGFLVPEANYPFVMTVVHSPKPLTGFTGVGVTVEPASGSPKPTGPRIFKVDF